MIDTRNNAKRQEYEANSTLLIITSKIENKIAGCQLDYQGMLATINVNDKYREKRKKAGKISRTEERKIISRSMAKINLFQWLWFIKNQ